MISGSQRVRVLAVLAAITMATIACAGGSGETAREIGPEPTAAVTMATTEPTTSPDPTPTAQPAPTATASPQPTATAVPPTPTAPTPAAPTPPPEPPAADTASCVRIVDFADLQSSQPWFIVNDGVMGGRSVGSAELTADGALLFQGEINTNGGGFSSIRTTIDLGALTGTTVLRIRARNSDERSYEVIVDDLQPGRDARISHFGAIPLEGSGEWETVDVSLDALDPRLFGRPVTIPAVEPALVTGVGIILSDGIDGPFQLEVSTIDACTVTPEPPPEA